MRDEIWITAVALVLWAMVMVLGVKCTSCCQEIAFEQCRASGADLGCTPGTTGMIDGVCVCNLPLAAVPANYERTE